MTERSPLQKLFDYFMERNLIIPQQMLNDSSHVYTQLTMCWEVDKHNMFIQPLFEWLEENAPDAAPLMYNWIYGKDGAWPARCQTWETLYQAVARDIRSYDMFGTLERVNDNTLHKSVSVAMDKLESLTKWGFRMVRGEYGAHAPSRARSTWGE
jgi:hypothetical protein